jgi:hypothetical protein
VPATFQKPAARGPRAYRRLAAGAVVVVTAGSLLAACGRSAEVGAETTAVREKVETRIKASAARNHISLNELNCLSVDSTKLACLAHVKSANGEETTATVTASFDNHTQHYKLEGPAELVASA